MSLISELNTDIWKEIYIHLSLLDKYNLTMSCRTLFKIFNDYPILDVVFTIDNKEKYQGVTPLCAKI
jgi:hypothetical protein